MTSADSRVRPATAAMEMRLRAILRDDHAAERANNIAALLLMLDAADALAFMTPPTTEASRLVARMARHLAAIMPTTDAAERAAHVVQILRLDDEATPLEIATAVCVHARRPFRGGERYVSASATVGQIQAALAGVVSEWEAK